MKKLTIKLNENTDIDLLKLVDTRLLLQANSGGGKSWAIRRIIEQAFGKVQIIVLDPEGEFINLRQEFDFVIAGKDADAPVNSGTAAKLAERLLELKASAIIDLYELTPQERKHFVKLFLDSMIHAPKELWHDCLVIIDEAHIFAPEKGESEAMQSVINLASLGRKRGFGAVLATQRLPKLNKDAAAECNNKMIGRASQDIDRKRAAEELGFSSREETLSLRNLKPGEFYVFGPAIFDEVTKIKIGDVKVKPPLRGQSKVTAAPPTEKVKKILGALADLPAVVKKEALTVSDLKEEIRNLKQENGILKRQPKTTDLSEYTHNRKVAEMLGTLSDIIVKERDFALQEINLALERLNYLKANIERSKKLPSPLKVVTPEKTEIVKTNPQTDQSESRGLKADFIVRDEFNGTMGKGEKEILNAIAQYPSGITNSHIAILTGYKQTSRRVYLQKLKQRGFIIQDGENIIATDIGITELGQDLKPLPTGRDLIEHWLSELPEGERKIFSVLVNAHDNSIEPITKTEIGEETGYKTTSVRVYLQKLAARQLIEINKDQVKLSSKI